MVGTNAYTNEKNKLYNSTVQDVSRWVGYWSTKVGALCDSFVDMGDPVKIQVGNGISKLFDFRGQTVDLSDQAIFIFKYFGLRYE